MLKIKIQVNLLNRIACLLILLSLISLKIFGQTEYLVKMNPSTGAYTKIDSLLGVKLVTIGPSYTAFDENGHRFIFKGKDSGGNYYLYSVDAISGNIITNPSFPVLSDPLDNIVELQYDNSSNTLYGLHWSNSLGKEFFVSVDPITGIYTDINSLSGVTNIAVSPNFTTYDKNNHRYIFKGKDNNGNWYLYSIDANTGNIITNPSFPVLSDSSDNIIELQYDNTSNILYGLHWNNSLGIEYLVAINPVTGTYTDISSLPGVQLITSLPHYTTFDEVNHRYIFRGKDSNGIWRLYSVDVNTGQIISSPIFPVLTNPSDNIIELQFDNSSGILYGLHWEACTVPFFSLGNDTILCEGDSMLLNVNLSSVTYLWQDSSMSSTYNVTQSGTYWLTVTSTCGSIKTDSININYISFPIFNFGNDTTLCQGQIITLNGGSATSYLWSTNSTASSINVATSGTYWLQASNGQCSDTDSIYINYSPLPIVNLGNDTTLCQGQTITLNGGSATSYLWSNGATASAIDISEAGTYWVQASNGSCSNSDTIAVFGCETEIELPNIFTPNNDGINDAFIIKTKNIETLNCKIYNRWGTLVNELTRINEGWDGRTMAGIQCTTGIYYYIVEYKSANEKIGLVKGFVELAK